jgi:outer membrane protein TolC
VAVSRTLATSLPKLYAAAVTEATRAKWFPKGKFEGSSQTRDKYFRGAWGKGARLEINFYSKGADKAQLAVQISKLAGTADVEAQREIWKSALGKLQDLLEP